jgi:hypothetical protein
MLSSIAWSAFTWEAFATLLAGLAAVAGAFFLGRRQIEILGRQTHLQESNLKISIFEKRMDVFRSVERFIYGVIAAGGPVSHEIERGFLIAEQEARFLFAKDVIDFLSEVWNNYVQLKVFKNVMQEEHEESGHYGEESRAKVHAAMQWISNCSDSLAQRFESISPIF